MGNRHCEINNLGNSRHKAKSAVTTLDWAELTPELTSSAKVPGNSSIEILHVVCGTTATTVEKQ